ncbi:MAG: UDP-N-acetylmuramate dehydrogenase [Candidatus Glassbacteria bacterium]
MNLDLEGIDGVKVRKDVSLAALTSIGTGGRARYLVEVEKREALPELIRRVRHFGFPATETFVLGGGTNLLVSDEGYDGLIIRLIGEFNRIDVRKTTVVAGAAVSVMKLMTMAEEEGLGGLEFLAGIPGTIGGAVAMNAGAWGKGIWDVVETVSGVDESGHGEMIKNTSHGVEYRSGNLPTGFIVAEAVLRIDRIDPDEVASRVREVMARRRKLAAGQLRTFGSVFKNPPGHFAGRLLEQAGVKGLKRGGAMISEDHANFIVNVGNATSGDVLELMRSMRCAVWDKFRVELVPEVILLGFKENAVKS